MTNSTGAVVLSKRTVSQAQPRAARYILWDSELPGFGLRVSTQGVKTYIVRYRVGGGRAGTLRQLVVGRHGALTPEQARKAAVEALANVTLGEDPQGDRAKARAEKTVSELCDEYLLKGVGTKKASTVYTDKGRIARHIKPLLGKRRVSAVTEAHVAEFMADVAAGKTAVVSKTKKRGKAVVRGGRGAATRTVGLLGAIFEFAIRQKYRKDNPVRGVERFKDRSIERFLSVDEAKALGAALDGPYSAKALTIIRVLALTGARKGEVVNLKWSEVDFERSCLDLGDSKTGEKIIAVGADALELIDAQPREVELANGKRVKATYVFPSETDPHRPFNGLEKVWEKVRVAAGLPTLRLHDLRHNYASAGLMSGQNLGVIRRLLGHADIKTTTKYAHVADAAARAAADRIGKSIAASFAPKTGKDAGQEGEGNAGDVAQVGGRHG